LEKSVRFNPEYPSAFTGICKVLNSQVQTNFDVNDFDHFAFYNPNEQRIEMHLTAKSNLQVTIGCTNDVIHIEKGETIHTENSCKFTPDRLEGIGNCGGMRLERVITDSKAWFSLAYYKK